MQAVTECTVLSSFCYQKKVSWHPLANRTHAGVKSFRLLKAICLIDGWPHSDRSRYHASTVQRPACGYHTRSVCASEDASFKGFLGTAQEDFYKYFYNSYLCTKGYIACFARPSCDHLILETSSLVVYTDAFVAHGA